MIGSAEGAVQGMAPEDEGGELAGGQERRILVLNLPELAVTTSSPCLSVSCLISKIKSSD